MSSTPTPPPAASSPEAVSSKTIAFINRYHGIEKRHYVRCFSLRDRLAQSLKNLGIDPDALARGEGGDDLAKLMAQRIQALGMGLPNQPPATPAGVSDATGGEGCRAACPAPGPVVTCTCAGAGGGGGVVGGLLCRLPTAAA